MHQADAEKHCEPAKQQHQASRILTEPLELNGQADPERFVFVERWTNNEAIEHHRKTEHYRIMGAAIGDLLSERQVLLLDEVPGQ